MAKRNPYDYYRTPLDELKKFIKELDTYDKDVFRNVKNILDPCAGGDKNNGQIMPYPIALREVCLEAEILTNDIREESYAQIKSDYLQNDFKQYNFDLIATNPPFNLALEIMSKSLNDVVDGGYVIMLVRASFLGSQRRKAFWEANMPKYIFYHHRRMSFVEGGQTDNSEYVHLVFQKGYSEKYSKIFVI